MQNAIEMVNITKTFGDKVVANSNVTMNIRHKEILSLLGENGSGKTTLMNMLAGIYYPDSVKSFLMVKRLVLLLLVMRIIWASVWCINTLS